MQEPLIFSVRRLAGRKRMTPRPSGRPTSTFPLSPPTSTGRSTFYGRAWRRSTCRRRTPTRSSERWRSTKLTCWPNRTDRP